MKVNYVFGCWLVAGGRQRVVRSKGLIHTNINQLQLVYQLTGWPETSSQILINCLILIKHKRCLQHECAFCIRWKGKVVWSSRCSVYWPSRADHRGHWRLHRGHSQVRWLMADGQRDDQLWQRLGGFWGVKLPGCSAVVRLRESCVSVWEENVKPDIRITAREEKPRKSTFQKLESVHCFAIFPWK